MSIGQEIVDYKRENNIHGCPTPLGQNEEPSNPKGWNKVTL